MEINVATMQTTAITKRDSGVESVGDQSEKQDFSSILNSELPSNPKTTTQPVSKEKLETKQDEDPLDDDPSLVAEAALQGAANDVRQVPPSYNLQTIALELASEANLPAENEATVENQLELSSKPIQLTQNVTEESRSLERAVSGSVLMGDNELALMEKKSAFREATTDVLPDDVFLDEAKPQIKIEENKPVVLEKSAPVDLSTLEKTLSVQEPQPVIGHISNNHQQNLAPISNNNVKVDTPVGDAGWRDAFSEKVLWLSNQNIKSATVQLNPQELGPIDISIKVSQQQAAITINAQHGATREAILDAMPTLRTMLADNGLQLQDVSVNERSSGHERQREAFQSRDEDPGFAKGYSEPIVEASNSRVKQTRLNAIDYYA